jgi:hypothetical protein
MINNYGGGNPQRMSRKVTLGKENASKSRYPQDPTSIIQIELPSIDQCAPLCRKPLNSAPFITNDSWNGFELDRMVRVESFTTLSKLGPGKEESFTSMLISKVCLVKTLKTLKLPKIKVANEK